MILAGPEIVEELVDDEKNAIVRMNLGERRHHFLEGRLVVDDLVGGWEGIADAVFFEKELELLRDDVPKRHLAGDLDTVDLEFSGNRLCRFGHFGVLDQRHVGRVLGHQRKDRHQVRFTGSVVTDNENTCVVYRLVKRELGDHELRDPPGHVVGNDVGRNQLLRFIRTVGVQKLNDRFYRLELNKIVIAHRHRAFPPSMNFERDQAVNAVVLIFWMSCRGVEKPALTKIARPHCNDATRVSVSPQ